VPINPQRGRVQTTEINPALLRARPLPQPQGDGKGERGRMLVAAGSSELPGAALLVGDAALRAGAGTVAVVTPAESIAALGMALPEARVFPLQARPTTSLFDERDAVVIGPGLESKTAARWAEAALARTRDVPLLLDAAALERLWHSAQLKRRRRDGGAESCIVTPHAGELAAMAGLDKDAILGDPVAAAADAASHLGVIVLLKADASSVVAASDGRLFQFHRRVPGLATSGSGEVLAGLIGGLLARGTPPIDAALWGVFLHAQAARCVATRRGAIGYRAAEIAADVPLLMESMR
jgi:ADP-dependent NAD(P)H-hydrate dehydratase